MRRHDLTDDQWERLAPLLPPQRPSTGRPANDHRTVINGILWVLKTGAPWRDLPDRYGSWNTVSSRFRRWQQAGVWERILASLQRDGDAAGHLDWAIHYIDSTVVRAHQHAAGAKGGTLLPRHWAAAEVAFRPSCTSGLRALASRSPAP